MYKTEPMIPGLGTNVETTWEQQPEGNGCYLRIVRVFCLIIVIVYVVTHQAYIPVSWMHLQNTHTNSQTTKQLNIYISYKYFSVWEQNPRQAAQQSNAQPLHQPCRSNPAGHFYLQRNKSERDICDSHCEWPVTICGRIQRLWVKGECHPQLRIKNLVRGCSKVLAFHLKQLVGVRHNRIQYLYLISLFSKTIRHFMCTYYFQRIVTPETAVICNFVSQRGGIA